MDSENRSRSMSRPPRDEMGVKDAVVSAKLVQILSHTYFCQFVRFEVKFMGGSPGGISEEPVM